MSKPTAAHLAQATAFAERARSAGHDVPAYAIQQAAKDISDGSLIACHKCGERWPASLIDAKAPPGSEDFTILHCPPDYGPGWSPI